MDTDNNKAVIKVSKDKPKNTWIVECDNHDDCFPVREYEPLRDVFLCSLCSTEIKAADIEKKAETPPITWEDVVATYAKMTEEDFGYRIPPRLLLKGEWVEFRKDG